MNVYGLNTDTKINAAAGTTPEPNYYDPSANDSELWAITFKNLRTGKESIRVIAGWGSSDQTVGDRIRWTFDQTNRDGGTGTLTGIRRTDGTVEGILPKKSLTLHVMK